MTQPSDDQATPSDEPPEFGRDRKPPVARWFRIAGTFGDGVIATGVVGTIALLVLISIALHFMNHGFEVSHLSAAGQSEKIAAKVDHDAILAIGYRCANDASNTQKAVKVSDYMLTMAAADDEVGQPTNSSNTQLRAQPMSLEGPSYILTAIVLSHHIGWSRIALAEEGQWSSIAMQIFQWLIVGVGAITTVLISIKTISSERAGSHTGIGVAAIIFSTLGTSIATMNSFYAPRVTHDQNERTLHALQTLHLQLATGITREDTVCDPPDKWPTDWRLKRIKAIAEQYATLMSTDQFQANAPEDDKPNPASNNLTGAPPPTIATPTSGSLSVGKSSEP